MDGIESQLKDAKSILEESERKVRSIKIAEHINCV